MALGWVEKDCMIFLILFFALSKDLVKPGVYFWASNKLKRTMSGRWQKKVAWQMVMDGDQVNFFFFLPLPGVSICCIARPHNSTVCRLWGKEQNGGKGRCAQPCLPRGPPCLRRQDPSSVSKAIFTNAWKLLLLSLRLSCEGIKHRQIPSLGTQHFISPLCATCRGFHIQLQTVKIKSAQNKCLF